MPPYILEERGPLSIQPLNDNIDDSGQPAGGWWSDLGDTYADGMWGGVKDKYEELWARNNSFRETGYDGLKNIPSGYEQYADKYAYAQSQAEVDRITSNLDETAAARARLSKNTTMENLGFGLIAGIFDPINLVAGPTLKGVGFVKGALRGGAAFGGLNAGQELIRQELNPMVSDEERNLNIGLGFLVAGVISGGIGKFTKGGDAGTASLSPEVRARAEQAGDNLSDAMAAAEGNPLTDVIDFNGQGIRIIDGPHAKSERGIAAFFRSKEAFETRARASTVSRAADDALGDVIPDRVSDDAFPEIAADAPSFDALAGGSVRAADGAADDAADAATPFGDRVEGEANLGRAADEADTPEFEDTIFIDTAQLREQYKTKPWMNPRYEGITAYTEDAFQSPEEWINFTILHELHHGTTKQRAGQSKVDYENYINELAYTEMKAGKLPLSPTDSRMERLSLMFSPSGKLMRIAPRDRDVHGAAQGLAGDHSTLTLANKAGLPTAPGGSVFQRGMQWLIYNKVVSVAWRASYLKYLLKGVPQTMFGLVKNSAAAGIPKIGAAARQGKLKPQQFREYIGRAVFDDEPFIVHGTPLDETQMAFVREAAVEFRKAMTFFEDAARKLGMFDVQKRTQRDIDYRTNAIDRMEKMLPSLRRGHPLRQDLEDQIQTFKDELPDLQALRQELLDNPMLPPREKHYFPRIFNISVVRERYDDLVALIGESYGGDAAAMARAANTVDKIIGEGGDNFTPGLGGPRALLSRQIPLTNKELADFIITDVESVMGIYSRRMGPAIEMTRKYGSMNADEMMLEQRLRMIEKGYKPKQIQEVLTELGDMRDRVLGRFHAKDPMSWDNRAARAIKSATQLAVMGRGIYAQVVDVARTVARDGYKPVFQAMEGVLNGEFKQMQTGRYANAGGEALEMVNASWSARLIENDSAFMVTNQTGIERGLASAQLPFFTMNGMMPFTVMWKDFSSIMSGHVLIDHMQNVAAAVRAGRGINSMTKAEQKQMQYLASYGIDLRTAQMIADMPIERTPTGKLWLANLDAWEGPKGQKSREAFLAALNGHLRGGTITPGPLQRPAIFDGVFNFRGERREVPLAALPFQLMSFPMAASAKITHAMLSGRDRQAAVTLASLIMGGYISSWLASGDEWQYMSFDEKLYSAIDRSGALGWMGEAVKRTEALTTVGPRGAMGLYQFGEGEYNDQFGAVGGPGVGVMAGVIEAFANPDLEDDRRAQLVRRGVIFNNMVWWDESMQDLASLFAEGGLVDLGEDDFGEIDESQLADIEG